jgi:acetyl esterase/lipase
VLVATVVAVAIVSAGCFPLDTPVGTAPLRYRDAVFGAVTVTKDITFGSATNVSGATVTLKMDEYAPAGDTATSRPAIVWVHGGSFSSGDKTSGELVDEATTFAKAGYVNVSINYRLEPGGCSASNPTNTCIQAINEATQDAQTAVRYLRGNAATFGIDPNRISIGGTSAGAFTALQVGYSTAEDATARVRAAVSLSGGNLLAAIGAADAPALLFHGTADVVVPYTWAQNTIAAASAAGVYAHLVSWSGDGHVPYAQHRTEILTLTTNFLYAEMDLKNAPQ